MCECICLLNFHRHTIESEFHIWGKHFVYLLMESDVVRHVGEVGVTRLDAIDSKHRFVYAPVRRMGLPAEGVDDEGVDAFELAPLCIWDAGAVGDVCELADAEGEDREFAVEDADRDDLCFSDSDGIFGCDSVQIDLRNTRVAMYEDIVVVIVQSACNSLVGIGVKRVPEGVGTQVIESGTVVEVIVSDEECVETPDIVLQCLLAEVWSAVDKYVLIVVCLDKYACTQTGVARIL